jgi:hypothetical protein
MVPLRVMVMVSKPLWVWAGKPSITCPWYMLHPSRRLKSFVIVRPRSSPGEGRGSAVSLLALIHEVLIHCLHVNRNGALELVNNFLAMEWEDFGCRLPRSGLPFRLFPIVMSFFLKKIASCTGSG